MEKIKKKSNYKVFTFDYEGEDNPNYNLKKGMPMRLIFNRDITKREFLNIQTYYHGCNEDIKFIRYIKNKINHVKINGSIY